jgi:hypothetical protein
MTSFPNGDLVFENGLIIPAEKRTRCEVFSRIVGYMRPVAQWNKGKQSEWKDRVNYVVPKIDSGNEVKGEGGSDA